MTKKIWWDEGHGGVDPGAVANGLKEKDLVVKIVKYAMDYLNENHIGFEQRSTRGLKDITVDLSKRDDGPDAWKADVFISSHINAGKGTGFESYIYNGQVSAATQSLQNVVHAEIVNAIKQFGAITDRGKKRANFAVVRETNMPALLTETLFIDSNDHRHLKDETFLKAVGEAHARGVAKFLGLPNKQKPKPVDKGNVKYKVQVGAFSEKANADRLAADLKAKGFPVYIVKE
jgi:N-acetylmuramoyl-L-alanine amidase